ncbi:MAG: DNA topoisomerase IV subunit B [Anaerolineae bacterium]|nr:DNA topoisomerase IV subunit B [Anaerolineae bacterium]
MAERTYSAEQIQVLEGLEAIRRRPGMYVGGTGTRALHHLVYEAVDNAVDEALAGACTEIEINLHKDGSVEVIDNGSGIPPWWKPDQEKAALEVVYTVLHSGGKFGGSAYKASGGLHGVGVKGTNALSAKLIVTVKRHGLRFRQEHALGIPQTAVQVLDPHEDEVLCELSEKHTEYNKLPADVRKRADRTIGTGTIVHFWPDGSILEETEFERQTLSSRFLMTAFLIPAKITLRDLRGKKKEQRVFVGKHKSYTGLTGLVAYLNDERTSISNNSSPMLVEGQFEIEHKGADPDVVKVSVAFQYTDDPGGEVVSFANTIMTRLGGTHVSGVRQAFTAAINQWAQKRKKLKGDRIEGADAIFGLTLVTSVLVPEPQFTSQTKDELASPIRPGVYSLVYNELLKLFEKKPKLGDTIVELCSTAANERKATAQARKLVARRSAMMEIDVLPGKLADVRTEDPRYTGLYLVEGDSAGGSAKQGRSRSLHAILPLRGKILNTERARITRILSSNEVKAIVAAVGAGLGADFNLDDMRYHRVVIFVDADVDGGHIAALLLTFFYRHMRPLVDAGRLYLARAPLYKLSRSRGSKDNETHYVLNDQERDAILERWGASNGQLPPGVRIGRFKGLGEMSADEMAKTVLSPGQEQGENGQVHESILNPYHVQVTVDDAHRAHLLMARLMGSVVEPRRKWLLDTWETLDVMNGNGDH